MPTAPRKSLLVNFAWVMALGVVLAVGYVMSYAPMYRWKAGPDGTGFHFVHLPGYGPVEWLIDNTALSKPLLWWGDVWGVGDKLWIDSDYGP
jgi:hypothetical protein